MTPSVINHTSLPCLPNFPQTSQSLRARKARTPRTISCLSICGVTSNNIVDDSTILRLFQSTLMGDAAKWYIELAHTSYPNFSSLTSMFLQYFQLSIRYEEGVEIFLSCRQTTTTHIIDHIHEWRRRRSLCKIELDDRIFLDWFLKTLLPPIAKDIASE